MKIYEYVIRLKDQASDKLGRLTRGADSGKRSVDRFGNSLTRAWSSSNLLGSSLGSLTRWLGPAALAAALTLGATKASALSREFEQTTISFEVMLGNAKKGRALLGDIEQMANITPFTARDLQSSGKLLLGYGVSVQKIMPSLRMLGDISGGNAEKLHLLSLAYAQSQAAGRLMGQDLLQMVNAGFNPLQTISEKTGISIGVLKKKMEDGAISASLVEKAFRAATSEGGRFFGMMEKQSQTFAGRMSTLKDKTEIWLRGVGENINSFLSPLLDVAIGKLDELIDKGGKLVNDANKQKDAFRNLQTNIRPLIDEYLRLNDVSKRTVDQNKRLKDVTNQIGKAVPLAVSKWDAYGNAMKINAVDAGFYIKEQENLFKLQNKNAQDSVLKSLEELEQKRKMANTFINSARKGDFKTVDDNKFIGSGLAELAKIGEEETKLRNQLSQLRNDKVLAYLNNKTGEAPDEWKNVVDDLNGKGKKGKDGTDRITGGGKQAVNVTINIQNLSGIQNIEEVKGEMEVNQLMKKMKEAAMEAMIEVVNSANYAQAQ